jgi:hypothetical protein
MAALSARATSVFGSLVEKLEMRGLNARLVSYPVEGVKGRHQDALSVTNTAAPERGLIHVEKDGSVTWIYSGNLDDAGISKILDEATNALRATGLILASAPTSRQITASS